MIIAGFPGVGKSHFSQVANIPDVDFVNFTSLTNYISTLQHHDLIYGNVFASCDLKVLKKLKSIKANFRVVIPSKELKYEYIERYRDRGNSLSYIEVAESEWDSYLDLLSKEFSDNIITLESNQFISFLFDSHYRFRW